MNLKRLVDDANKILTKIINGKVSLFVVPSTQAQPIVIKMFTHFVRGTENDISFIELTPAITLITHFKIGVS